MRDLSGGLLRTLYILDERRTRPSLLALESLYFRYDVSKSSGHSGERGFSDGVIDQFRKETIEKDGSVQPAVSTLKVKACINAVIHALIESRNLSWEKRTAYRKPLPGSPSANSSSHKLCVRSISRTIRFIRSFH